MPPGGGGAQVSGLERGFLIITREALNPGKQAEWSDTTRKRCALLAQEKRQQAKEVKHKWKGIQVNFLEELTLFETCLDVPDIKQPWAEWIVSAGRLAVPSRGQLYTLACTAADQTWESAGCWLPLWRIPVPISRSQTYLRQEETKQVPGPP